MPDFVDWFVNREKQYLGFQKMLARETPKSVMIIEDQAEMGKSWLLQRIRHHCQAEEIPAMFVDFRDRRPHDYLSLVRLARDQIGTDFFAPLTETINRFTSVNINLVPTAASPSAPGGGQPIAISAQGQGHVTVQSVAGRDVVNVQDNQFYVQADSEMARRAAEIQINDAFFAGLGEVLRFSPVVLLFDSYEGVTAEAERWLQDFLLLRKCEDELDPLLILIAGRRTPEIGPTLKPLVAKTKLDPLNEAHVREYIEERRRITGLDIATIIRTCGGHPGLLAKMADVAALGSAEDDDDWL